MNVYFPMKRWVKLRFALFFHSSSVSQVIKKGQSILTLLAFKWITVLFPHRKRTNLSFFSAAEIIDGKSIGSLLVYATLLQFQLSIFTPSKSANPFESNPIQSNPIQSNSIRSNTRHSTKPNQIKSNQTNQKESIELDSALIDPIHFTPVHFHFTLR